MDRVFRRGFAADEDTTVVLAAVVAVLIVLVVGAIGAAIARDDAGIHQFFANEAGGGVGLRPTTAPEASSAPPLVIHAEQPLRSARGPERLRKLARDARARSRFAARKTLPSPVIARAETPPLPPIWGQDARPALVSIYEDRTLRRGDAVMTLQGIRIFAGSSTFPFRPEDFRNLAEMRQHNSPFRRILTELDRLPKAS